MKSTPRFTARRVFQGGAAFAAFGALSLAAALPAYADGETYGWASASAAGGQDRLESQITQQQSESGTFDASVGSWLNVSGTTSVLVDDNGAQAGAVVESGRIVLTEGDLEDVLSVEAGDGEGDDDTDGEGGEGDDTDGEGDDGTGDDSDGEGDDGTGDDSDGEGDDDTDGEGGEGDDTDGEGDDGTGDDTGGEGDTDDEELQDSASGVIELDVNNTVLTDGADTIVFEDTFTGSVTTTQTWDGDVTHESTPEIGDSEHLGRFQAELDGENVTVDVVLAAFGGEEQNTDSGFEWDDAYTFLTLNFAIDGEYVSGFPVAESMAGITTGVHGGDDGGDNGGDSGGDDKTPPNRSEDNVPKPDPKEADLAQTGSPVLGLIAAGAAITAGGGAAAYLARRKKKNNEEFNETDN
ncbi:LPXTG cell wall anchor domain-containing protein [Nocardiopsis exhalans]|uniref:LPXTG cell wall anchor domain-containing protein n=1 Tax=Nocardiopsis exhalans TaxID=163604 RepID=A0ABY5D900_9ACTN|nr:LPXTG cell wall anchor domain-containing protein [Nocardiopsis exhalans]USY19809.1 LPXTG cell wall anchor domain-containing protein [Nocardiopsis exhalans]